MSARRHPLCAALLAAPLSALAAPTVPLAPGGSVRLSVPASSFTNDVYVDVPEGAQQLTVRLLADNPAQDVDLLLRFDSAFPDRTIDGQPPEAEWLFDHAQYQSTSAAGDEQIVLSRSGSYPLRAGRLFISVVNFASSVTPATLSASLGSAEAVVPISVRFDDPGSSDSPCNTSGWNDATARAPLRGNSGTTLGQQRRNAMLEAARLLTAEIRPQVPITLRACWGDLPFSSSGGTLAQAGPRSFFLSDVFTNNRGVLQASMRFLNQPYTIYSQAAAAQQAGTRACGFAGGDCARQDVNITFNLAVDNATQANRRFDYGFTHEQGQGSSFISTAMHEIAHGLGFLGLIRLNTENGGVIGDRLSQYDDIYGKQVLIAAFPTSKPFLRASVEERAAALVAGSQLRFTGPTAVASTQNVFNAFAPPENLIRLHTPNTIAGGSTYSHLSIEHPHQAMQAAISGTGPRTLGLATDMLQDLGWSRAAKSPPGPRTPAEGQYFDPTRNGHGFDFRRVAGTTDLYFLVYYSFDANGNPEWFNAVGRSVDGLFVPARNQFGDSLLQNLFRAGQNPQTVVDDSAAFSGQVRIDFVGAKDAPACQTRSDLRPNDASQNLMTWILNDKDGAWCSQPLLASNAGVAVDYSGIWFNPADPGWGITFLSFRGDGGDGLAAQIYYPDATGRGRWAIMQTPRYQAGGTYPVFQVSNGYCRDCPAPAELSLQQIGTITVALARDGSSRVSFSLTYPGTEGGTFTRSNSPLQPGSEPRF
jgi:hypothetical protein